MFIRKIDNLEDFALARYWDWEHMLIEGKEVWPWTQASVQDKRQSPQELTLLWLSLSRTMDICSSKYFYAIPCCCNPQWELWYREHIKSDNITYANVFINGNYPTWERFIKTLKRDVIVIANHEGKDKRYPFPVKKFIPMSDDCVNYYKQNCGRMLKSFRILAKESTNQLFFISAWPMANVIVYEMFKANPHNTYIDVGSALDLWTKWRATRGFHLSTPNPNDMYARRECYFTCIKSN